MFCLLILISLLAINAYDVTAATLNASLLNQFGYNNQSDKISLIGYFITDIDPNAFKGYTQLRMLSLVGLELSKIDLEIFNDSVNLGYLKLSENPLTQLTNSKKIQFPSLRCLFLDNCALNNLDSNVINALPNLIVLSVKTYHSCQLSPLAPNQLSPLKQLQFLFITTRNQRNLTKDHFNGLNSLFLISFERSNIEAIAKDTFSDMPNLTFLDLFNNSLTSLEFIKFPPKIIDLNLGGNRLSHFALSKRTLGAVKKLHLNDNQFIAFRSIDFNQLGNLTFLDLSNNPHACPYELPFQMKPLAKLETVLLVNISLKSIDSFLFKHNYKLTTINVNYNNICDVSYDSFSNLKNLTTLDLSSNQISDLDNRTFLGLDNLVSIYLNDNKLTKISPGTFSNLGKLQNLIMNDNSISEIDSSAFTGCSSLGNLILFNNRMTKLSPRTFSGLTINMINLANNQITQLDNLTFDGVNSIGFLFLSSNNISKICPGTFSGVKIIEHLALRNNLLTEIYDDTFVGLNSPHNIDLGNNKITTIESGSFNDLKTLQYIYLDNNNLTRMDNSTFAGCDNLQGIYLGKNHFNVSTSDLQSLCSTDFCDVFF